MIKIELGDITIIVEEDGSGYKAHYQTGGETIGYGYGMSVETAIGHLIDLTATVVEPA